MMMKSDQNNIAVKHNQFNGTAVSQGLESVDEFYYY